MNLKDEVKKQIAFEEFGRKYDIAYHKGVLTKFFKLLHEAELDEENQKRYFPKEFEQEGYSGGGYYEDCAYSALGLLRKVSKGETE